MSSKERLAQIKQEVQDLKKEAQEKAQAVFNEETKGIFRQFPMLKSFCWAQYTPYFNDGDTCYFSSHHDEFGYTFEFSGEEVKVEMYEGFYGDVDPKIVSMGETIQRAISEVLNVFDDDDFESMFGDHAIVTVTKDGAQPEDYDHD